MEWRYTISACLLILVTLLSLVNSLEDDKELELDFTDVDHSKYVDPFDMINYNRNSLSEADELNNQENPFEILPRPLTQHEEITKNLVVEDMIESPVVMKHLSHPQKNLGSLKHCGLGKGGDWEKPFLLRFVLILSNLLTIKVFTYFSPYCYLYFLNKILKGQDN